jgi:hypothetical protein
LTASAASERGAVDDHIFGERIDGHRAKPIELGENGELGDPQADRRQS